MRLYKKKKKKKVINKIIRAEYIDQQHQTAKRVGSSVNYTFHYGGKLDPSIRVWDEEDGSGRILHLTRPQTNNCMKYNLETIRPQQVSKQHHADQRTIFQYIAGVKNLNFFFILLTVTSQIIK